MTTSPLLALPATPLATRQPLRSQHGVTSKPYVYVGLGLFGLFLLQYGLGIKLTWLAHWQQLLLYKQLTGFGMALYIFLQWRLGLTKINNQTRRIASTYRWHKSLGALAPLMFFMHSMHWGYAYQMLLSIAYFGNFLCGLCNPEVLGVVQRRLRTGWLCLHIGLAVLTVSVMLFHIYVVYWYA
jgi:hypothetical protein